MKMVKGWFNESRRHALARQGIRTGRKTKLILDRWGAKSPSLLESDLRRYRQLGGKLIKANLISGYQIRDIDEKGLKGHKLILYAHGDRRHINSVLSKLRNQDIELIAEFPRISGYKWDADWQVSTHKTKIYRIDTGEKAKLKDGRVVNSKGQFMAVDTGEAYIIIKTEDPQDVINFFKDNTFKGKSKRAIKGSWEVPDIRAKNITKAEDFKKAMLVRKRIDEDTEFATIVPKRKVEEVKKAIKGKEKVEPILVQDVKGHSLYQLVRG